MYGAPRAFKMVDHMDELNKGMGEAVAYRGRLLISIKTKLLDDEETAGASTVYMDKLMSSEKVCN